MEKSNLKVAILINFITPYGRPMFEYLTRLVGNLRIFVSTRMEANRNWDAEWINLDVRQQKSVTRTREWQHPNGFSETIYTHFPYSTLWDLCVYKPDVVISTEMGFRTLLAIIYKLINPRIKLIVWSLVSEHTEISREKKRRLLRKVIFRFADAVLVNGKSGARYISSFGVPSDKLFFAPYTTDITPFLGCTYPIGDIDEFRLLYVGQLTQRKGLTTFIECLNEWAKQHQDRKVRFDILGDGSQKNDIDSFKTSPNLTIDLYGPIAYKNLPGFYSSKHLFVFPTLADEWGVVVNEAMASGLPILGSRYSQAIEELIIDGTNGFVFSPDNRDEMFKTIDRALSTPVSVLKEIGQNNRQKIRAFTPEDQAKRIVQAIDFVGIEK